MAKKHKKLSIQDFTPQRVSFKLKNVDADLWLRPWSLRVKAWAIEKYGVGELRKIMEGMKTVQIAEICFFMMEDESKNNFKNQDDFFDKIQAVEDELSVHRAVLSSMGIGEPQIEELEKIMLEAAELPDPKTLAPSDKNTK